MKNYIRIDRRAEPPQSRLKDDSYKDLKDLEQDSEGRAAMLCIDGKAHSFSQIKYGQYGSSYIFRIIEEVEEEDLAGNKIITKKQNNNYFTRLFCKKCSLSVVTIVKKENEDYTNIGGGY